jgi:hypothetical protein
MDAIIRKIKELIERLRGPQPLPAPVPVPVRRRR